MRSHSMTLVRVLACVPACVLTLASTAGAQGSLASRVRNAPDGIVRMEYDARPGTCGDGGETVAFRRAYFGSNVQSWGGKWNDARCVPGNVRVTATVTGGEVVRVRTQIGGRWPATNARVTDLGIVSPGEASAYFLSLVPSLESRTSRNQVLRPAVLADDPAILAPLVRIARDDRRLVETRREAISWMGLLGDASVVQALVHFAKDDGDSRSDAKSLRSAAVFSLSLLEDGAGVAPLLELSRDDSPSLRKATVFPLSETGDPRAFRRLRQMLDDTRESRDLRKDALFWLGQRAASPTEDIVSFYRANDDVALREQAIFVLSQRKDDAAIDALLRIARSDDDKRMRAKAMFWLAQTNDPRVVKLLGDILSK